MPDHPVAGNRTNTNQLLLHLCGLEFRLAGVPKVLPGASSAGFGMLAGGLYAQGGRAYHPINAPFEVALLAFDDANVYHVAWSRAAN